MNRKLVTAMLLAAAVVTGIFIGRLLGDGTTPEGAGVAPGEPEILYWVAPMDPNFRRDAPGKSPMGMDLVPVYAEEDAVADAAVVSIDPAVVNNLGVRTARAERGALSRRVETVGYVDYNEDALQQLHTRVDGWIESLSIKAAGDPIAEDQLLFQLYSPTLVNAQEEYLAAVASNNRSLISASRTRLAALGVGPEEVARLERERTANRLVSVFADSDGYAAALGVREGMYVTPATQIMSIARLDEVWVLVEVFERQAAWIQAGQQAEVELDFVPGQSWQGRVDYVYPELDPATRTLKVRLRIDNASGVLRPNMFARVTIFGSGTEPVVHVPKEALIRGGALDRVVLALGDGRFRAQPVAVGIESGDRVEIRSGVEEGELVVTSGQFLIDSESNIDTAMARLDREVATPLPNRMQIGAIVRAIDDEAPGVTLQHDPVPEWSWPAMTMTFPVADAALLAGLEEGQSVDVVVQRFADGRHRITEILDAPGSNVEGAEPGQPAMDHGTHEVPEAQEESPPPPAPHNMGEDPAGGDAGTHEAGGAAENAP